MSREEGPPTLRQTFHPAKKGAQLLTAFPAASANLTTQRLVAAITLTPHLQFCIHGGAESPPTLADLDFCGSESELGSQLLIMNLMDPFSLTLPSTLAPSALGTNFHAFLSSHPQEDTVLLFLLSLLSFASLELGIQMRSEVLEPELTKDSGLAGST